MGPPGHGLGLGWWLKGSISMLFTWGGAVGAPRALGPARLASCYRQMATTATGATGAVVCA